MKHSLLALFALFSSVVSAEQQELDERLKINLGMFWIWQTDTIVAAAKEGLVGSKIHLQDDLNLDTENKNFKIDGYYRITNYHRIEFAYLSLRSDGSNELTRDITWDGQEYKVGAFVDSYSDIDIYKINYAYSFYHNEDVELSVSLGVHAMDFDVGLSTGVKVEDGSDNGIKRTGSSVDLIAPLPVIGFRLDYQLAEDWKVIGSVDYFSLKIDDYSGYFLDFIISAEYSITESFATGVGFTSTSLNFSVDKDDDFAMRQDMSGGLFYISYIY
ncbi:hypothetical protein BCU00_010425 [Vibrio breoganii]|uniref:DUF481 domain-containing protein n=1 Tax=Vibrio breoganii TaxID=553239 RepID=A0AAN1CTR2_9VIBR|nr:hypothetical protein [Vibrio breoganii]ANO34923.1 hypothetical protein A6E01_17200 [Vibrio breoganii]PMK41076.1 hypothetical protein BCU00_01785 [Vibrio breoganii]PML39007.1 hypothetical protein BCT78_04810 [Vibrio breoganii]PMO34022.1 hypothetical protein BCT12_01435 [Vibrio breoganii]